MELDKVEELSPGRGRKGEKGEGKRGGEGEGG